MRQPEYLNIESIGYLPDALFNYLVRLGLGSWRSRSIYQDEMINYFRLDHVGKKGAIFDQQKLDWINGVYMRNNAIKSCWILF